MFLQKSHKMAMEHFFSLKKIKHKQCFFERCIWATHCLYLAIDVSIIICLSWVLMFSVLFQYFPFTYFCSWNLQFSILTEVTSEPHESNFNWYLHHFTQSLLLISLNPSLLLKKKSNRQEFSPKSHISSSSVFLCELWFLRPT